MTRTHVVSEDPDGTRCSDCKRNFEDGDAIHERVLKSMGTVDDLVHLPRATWDHDEPVWLIEPVCGECHRGGRMTTPAKSVLDLPQHRGREVSMKPTKRTLTNRKDHA